MRSETLVPPRQAIIAAVQLSSVTEREFEASVTELRELAKTLGFNVVRAFTQKRSSFDAGAYMGPGKREEIRRFVHGEAVAGSDGDDESGTLDAEDDVEDDLVVGVEGGLVAELVVADAR